MDLNAIANSVTTSVNPDITVTIQTSTGTYTTADDGTRTPVYTSTTASAQVQALTQLDLQHINGLNLQGQTASLYIPGNWNGIIRGASNGDLVTWNSITWRVVAVPEQWPNWTRVIICRQP